MTEREIVYSIIETLNNYEYNNDNRLSERLIRNFIQTYRGEILRKYYSEGYDVTDECLQTFPIVLKSTSIKNQFEFKTPQVLEFKSRQGFYLDKLGLTIPTVNQTVYSMLSDNELPVAKRQGSLLQVKIASSIDPCVSSVSENYILYSTLRNEASKGEIEINFSAVLVNPSDATNYDWTKDVYPFPGEKLDEFKTLILRKEFGVASQIKSDEVQNARVDNVRYHENTNLEQ